MLVKNKKHIKMLEKIVKDLETYRNEFPRDYYQYSEASHYLKELKELLRDEKRGWED